MFYGVGGRNKCAMRRQMGAEGGGREREGKGRGRCGRIVVSQLLQVLE